MVQSRQFTVAFCLFLILIFGNSIKTSGAETGFLNRTVKILTETYRYQVFVPYDWNKKQKLPVILFLHGAGERGEDGLTQTEVGIGSAIRRHVDRFPAIVVFPQCRRSSWWTDAKMQEQALTALHQTIKEFNGDLERIYLTGLSMGGYGTWSIASKYPGRFAVLVPICGGIRPPARVPVPEEPKNGEPVLDPYLETAKKIGQTPVWIFHGADDKIVPTEESRKMHDALKSAGGNVKYTEYEKVGHNSWDKAYAEQEMLTWMFAQKLKKPSAGNGN
ncbi:MAG: prolyl oligopeptidase family serine peptidase [Acidobacteria bacterium]|nr:prolyl oligopeptidase family serine peptidase [Acidobacteriota bacterium]